MVYSNFRIFIFMCFVFGIGKVLICSTGKITKLNIFYKTWSLAVLVAIVLSYFLSTIIVGQIKDNMRLAQIGNLNDFVVNILIILLNLLCGNKEYEQMYNIINCIFNQLKLSEVSQKIICLKIYVSLTVPLVIFIIIITLECIYVAPPFVLLIRIPTLFTILYVSLNLYVMFFILKTMNQILSDIILFYDKNETNKEEITRKRNIILSLFRSDMQLSFAIKTHNINLNTLRKMYDDASTCISYLEKLHGLQIVLAIWLSFSSAVVVVTLVVCHQSNVPSLEIVRSFLPLSWCFLVCYIEDQITKEVKQMETLVVKYLIDYRCDQATRNILQTFKQLVSTNRLTFTAGNVFRLDYGMILGTIVNVITYSIILIQLFLPE